MAAAAPAAGAATSGGGSALSGADYAAMGSSIAEPIIGAALMGVQHKWATKASRHQRKWQEYMSNTQYQRAVADLRAAGLNPALAYTQGGARYGSYESPQVPGAPDVRMDIGRSLSSAKQRQHMDQMIQAEQARIATERAQQGVLIQQERVAETNARVAEETALARARAEIKEIEARADATAKGIPRTAAETRQRETERYREAAKIPYSEEQKEVVRKGFREFTVPIRKAWEALKSSAKGVTEYREPGTESEW